eukprot:2009967-Pyramimonas_sp.AAC.1
MPSFTDTIGTHFLGKPELGNVVLRGVMPKRGVHGRGVVTAGGYVSKFVSGKAAPRSLLNRSRRCVPMW